MEDTIRILKVEPGKHPEETTMKNSLEAMQDMVGGYIEMVSLDQRTCLVCNEEGKLEGLEGNRRLGSDIIAGTFFLAAQDGEGNLCSLDEKQVVQYEEQFHEPETFTPQQVQDSIYMNFISF